MNKKIFFFSCFVIFLILVNFPSLLSYHYNYSGEKTYIDENYQEAIKQFSKGKNTESIYNIGNSYYKMKDYEKAMEYFLIPANGENNDLKFKSLHNLGNLYYRLGEQNEETKLENYLTSVSYYEQALEINYDEETEKNRDFVLEKIKELQKQQEEQQKQNEGEENNGENSQEKNNEGENNNGQDEENQNNTQEENNENNTSSNGSYQLDESQKAELEQYKKILEDMQENYGEGFNKIYNDNNDPFSDDFFFESFFNEVDRQEDRW